MTTTQQAQQIYLMLEQQEEQEREQKFLEQQHNKQFLAQQLKKDLIETDNIDLTANLNPLTLRIETNDTDNNQHGNKIFVYCRDRTTE
jgi:cytidylate kinase